MTKTRRVAATRRSMRRRGRRSKRRWRDASGERARRTPSSACEPSACYRPSTRETGDPRGDEIDTRGEDESSFELPDEGTLGALLSGGEVLGRVDDLAARAAAAIEANKPKGAGRTEEDEVEGGSSKGESSKRPCWRSPPP